MIGDTVAHYRIDRSLGEGGMGTVYAARDLKLERDVALKVIRADLSDPGLRDRFWREARAAASLNHPGICQIHDLREENGELFIVMELLEGVTLAERLAHGPLPVTEAVRAGLAVLEALGAIHRRGFVHRDIKPSNVFLLEDGRVKLLDFGLVLRVDGPEGPALTMTGLIMGSPRYMAPEQVRGGAVDARADLFALGVVLYEAVTGRPPFHGVSPVETMYAILHGAALSLAGSPDLEALDRVLAHALAKNAEDRPPTAEAMAAELRPLLEESGGAPAPMSPTERLVRLAVLPFRMLRPDADRDFLCASLSDAIAMSLAGIHSLVVRSPAAAARFATAAIDFRELARSLEVNVALIGTILPAGERCRVVAQLVETPSGQVIWSLTTDVTTHDVFELQDTLTRRIVESLQLPLSARERRALGRDVPASPTAYELFLRANQISAVVGHEQPVARDLYRKALETDPAYSPAWARLARCHRIIGKFIEMNRRTENYRLAEEALGKALALRPDLPMAHHYYGQLELDLGRSEPAIERLLQVVGSNPSDPEGFAGLVTAFRYVGLLEESLTAHREARRLSPEIATSVHHTLEAVGRLEEALTESKLGYGFHRARILVRLGRIEEAVALMREREERERHNAVGMLMTALRTSVEGDRKASLAAIDRLWEFPDPEGVMSLCWICARIGERERAITLFERVVEGYANLQMLLPDPDLDALRDDPRFAAALERAEARHQAAVVKWGGWRPRAQDQT